MCLSADTLMWGGRALQLNSGTNIPLHPPTYNAPPPPRPGHCALYAFVGEPPSTRFRRGVPYCISHPALLNFSGPTGGPRSFPVVLWAEAEYWGWGWRRLPHRAFGIGSSCSLVAQTAGFHVEAAASKGLAGFMP